MMSAIRSTQIRICMRYIPCPEKVSRAPCVGTGQTQKSGGLRVCPRETRANRVTCCPHRKLEPFSTDDEDGKEPRSPDELHRKQSRNLEFNGDSISRRCRSVFWRKLFKHFADCLVYLIRYFALALWVDLGLGRSTPYQTFVPGIHHINGQSTLHLGLGTGCRYRPAPHCGIGRRNSTRGGISGV